jgi:hypothetical protein
MGEILGRLILALLIGILIATPAALVAFVFGLATRRSVSESAGMARDVAFAIIEHAPWWDWPT